MSQTELKIVSQEIGDVTRGYTEGYTCVTLVDCPSLFTLSCGETTVQMHILVT